MSGFHFSLSEADHRNAGVEGLPPSIHNWFLKVQHLLAVETHWSEIDAERRPGFSLHSCRVSVEQTIMKITVESEQPPDVLAAMMSAEAMTHPDVLQEMQSLMQWRIITFEQLSVGDALIRLGTAIAAEGNLPFQILERKVDACLGPDPEEFMMRLVTKCDVPAPGCYTLFNLPILSELLNGPSCDKIEIIIIQPKADGGSLMIDVIGMPRVPDFALEQSMGAMQQMYEMLLSSPAFISYGRNHGFVYLNLKKVHRGGPLLPFGKLGEVPDEWDWQEAEAGQDFAFYLRSFLTLIGRPDLASMVHGALYGRRLARYQAVATREAWHVVWAALEHPFAVQRRLYRQRRGGAHAPVIRASDKPTFAVDPWKPCVCPTRAASARRRMLVCKTFVHVEDGRGRVSGSRERGRSLPNRVTRVHRLC